MYIHIFGKMEQYGALPIMSEKQNRKKVLVGKFSASSLGAESGYPHGGFQTVGPQCV